MRKKMFKTPSEEKGGVDALAGVEKVERDGEEEDVEQEMRGFQRT